MKKLNVLIIFKSGAKHEFAITETKEVANASFEDIVDGIENLAKMIGGEAPSKTLDKMWAVASHNPISAFMVNCQEVAFVSVTMEEK